MFIDRNVVHVICDASESGCVPAQEKGPRTDCWNYPAICTKQGVCANVAKASLQQLNRMQQSGFTYVDQPLIVPPLLT